MAGHPENGRGLQGAGRPERRLLLGRLTVRSGQTLRGLYMARQSASNHLAVL